jgi:hypothetical protein
MATSGDPTPKYLVHVNVTIPEERELLSFLLFSRQCEPVLLEGGFKSEAPPDAELIGIVTDVPLDPARSMAYSNSNVPALDYGAWRSASSQPTPEGYLDVSMLNNWLDEYLLKTVAQAAAA